MKKQSRKADGLKKVLVAVQSAVPIPASEEWLYRNPKALASVRRGLADAAAGRTISLGSFRSFRR
jgi:predicted transcriptional regulator